MALPQREPSVLIWLLWDWSCGQVPEDCRYRWLQAPQLDHLPLLGLELMLDSLLGYRSIRRLGRRGVVRWASHAVMILLVRGRVL